MHEESHGQGLVFMVYSDGIFLLRYEEGGWPGVNERMRLNSFPSLEDAAKICRLALAAVGSKATASSV